MNNSITYHENEGYIEVIIAGDQDRDKFVRLQYEALKIIERLENENKPMLALIDISKQTSFSADTNRASLEILESIDYDKVAIFGANKILTEVTKGIILAMGKSSNTKMFKDRESAIEWLVSV